MEEIFNYGLQGLIAFGVVGFIGYVRKDIPGEIKLALLIAIAFAVGFVPTDLGNEIFNRLKDAVAIGFGIHASWTAIKSVGGK